MTDKAMEIWWAAFEVADAWVDGEVKHQAAAAVIREALAAKDAEIARLREERDGARKAMDLFMSAPGMPGHILDWVRFQMSHTPLKVTGNASDA